MALEDETNLAEVWHGQGHPPEVRPIGEAIKPGPYTLDDVREALQDDIANENLWQTIGHPGEYGLMFQIQALRGIVSDVANGVVDHFVLRNKWRIAHDRIAEVLMTDAHDEAADNYLVVTLAILERNLNVVVPHHDYNGHPWYLTIMSSRRNPLWSISGPGFPSDMAGD